MNEDAALEVKFGADASGLVSGASTAKGEIDRIVQSIALLQKTVGAAARTTTSELTAAIQGMGSQASAAAPRIRQMTQEVAALSTAGHAGHGTIFGMQSGVFLELRALLDEALSGRMRNFEGSFARLLGLLGPTIQGFVTANPLLTAFGAAAAASAAAAAYLAVEMHAVAEAQEAIKQAAAFSGNYTIVDPKAAEAARQAIDTLRGIFKGLGEKDVGEIISSFEQMANTSNSVIGAMAADMAKMWQQFGADEKEAAKNIVKLFSDPLQSIEKIKSLIHQLSPEEQAFVEAAQKSGNVLQAQGAIQEVLAQRSKQSHAERIAQIDDEIARDRARQATTLAGDQTTRRMLQEHIDDLEKEKGEVQKVDDGIAGWAGKIRNAISTAQMLDAEFRQLIADANKVADAYDKVGAAQRKISSDAGTLTSGMVAALKAGDTEELGRLANAIPGMLRSALENSQQGADPAGRSRDQVAQAEEAFRHMENTWRGSQEGMKKAAVEFWTVARNQMGLTDTQQVTLTEKLEAAQKSLFDSQSKDGVKASRDAQRATMEILGTQISEAEETARRKIEIYRLEAKGHVRSEQEAARLITEVLRAELAQVDALYAREASTSSSPDVVKEKQRLADLKINDQIVRDNIESAEAAAKAWEKAGDSILSAWNGQLRGILEGTTSLRTAVANIAKDTALKVIESGEKMLVQTLAQQAAGLAAKKSMDVATVGGDAGRAAAGAYAATATVPIIGPVLAPAAAAAAYAGTMAFAAFDIGAYQIPADMPAIVHRNELVMPAAEAGAFRNMLSGAVKGDSANAAASGGDTHVHFNVSAINQHGVRQFFHDNGDHIMSSIHRSIKSGGNLRFDTLKAR